MKAMIRMAPAQRGQTRGSTSSTCLISRAQARLAAELETPLNSSMVDGSSSCVFRRFPSAAHLAAYAGTTPRVHASGGHTHYGPTRGDINRSLKWALIEAASNPCRLHQTRPHRHVSRRSARVQPRKGHATAVGAVARHLAEATYWILSQREPYRDPAGDPASSTEGPARSAHERETLGI